MTFEEMERMMQLVAEQQARTSEQQARTSERQAHTDEQLARMSERQARTDELLAFIAEQQATTSQALAKLTLDLTALSADVDRVMAIAEKNSADIAKLMEGFKKERTRNKELQKQQQKMNDRLDMVIRTVEQQAKGQDHTDVQIAALTTNLTHLTKLVEQYIKYSRNGGSNSN